MRSLKNLKAIVSLCFLFNTCILYGQNISNSDYFVNKWYFLGSNKMRVNDTLTLVKDLSKPITKDYTQWEFTDSNFFYVTYFKLSSIKENKFITVVENKMNDDVWYYDTKSNRLTIKNDTFQKVYSILSIKNGSIKLIKIE
jgi:hypothetical protein